MVRYVETFYRHRRLLLIPIVLILAVSGGMLLAQPPAYQSTARLWVDKQTALVAANSADSPYLTPAQNQAATLSELLTTDYFARRVGSRGPLAHYLASGSASPSLFSRILAKAHLGGVGAGQPLSQDAVDAMVYDIVSKNVLVIPTGPQVIEVTFTYSDPQVAAGTTQAVVDQFLDEVLATQKAQEQTAVDFYQKQVQRAQSDLAAADDRINGYLALHPELRSSNAVLDTKLIQLQRDDDVARQRYQGLQDKLDQAKISAAAVITPGASGYRVLDSAQVPTGSSLSKKLLLEALGIGLGLGLLILVGGLVLLTAADTTLRRPDEVEAALDLHFVGSVPKVRPRAA